jgi:cytochrome P450
MFNKSDEMMIDECITFMLAATQTTTLLITNALYFITKDSDVIKKIINELKTKLKRESFQGLSNDEWQSLL